MAEEWRPWEQPGAVRRDCEPHRGELLRWLGGIALVATIFGTLIVPAGVALALGLAVWLTARRDAALMGQGRMDPRGLPDTQAAGHRALLAVLLAVPLLVAWAIVLAWHER
jgi:hypothetical protein